jgi:hypothetical protein
MGTEAANGGVTAAAASQEAHIDDEATQQQVRGVSGFKRVLL